MSQAGFQKSCTASTPIAAAHVGAAVHELLRKANAEPDHHRAARLLRVAKHLRMIVEPLERLEGGGQ